MLSRAENLADPTGASAEGKVHPIGFAEICPGSGQFMRLCHRRIK
jgi:hypothetical protein